MLMSPRMMYSTAAKKLLAWANSPAFSRNVTTYKLRELAGMGHDRRSQIMLATFFRFAGIPVHSFYMTQDDVRSRYYELPERAELIQMLFNYSNPRPRATNKLPPRKRQLLGLLLRWMDSDNYRARLPRLQLLEEMGAASSTSAITLIHLLEAVLPGWEFNVSSAEIAFPTDPVDKVKMQERLEDWLRSSSHDARGRYPRQPRPIRASNTTSSC